MPFARLNRYAERLRELLHAIRVLPEAYLARRGGSELLRALAHAGGLRRACGILIDYTSRCPREQGRRYRRWIGLNEEQRDPQPVNLVLAVSFRGLDDDHCRFQVSHLVRTAPARVLVDVEPDRIAMLDALRARGLRACPANGGTGVDVLPADAPGIVFLGRACCLHDNALSAMARAFEAGADVVYGDSDRIDMNGRRQLPYFKPDFSRDLLFHQDYMSECVGVSRRIWDGEWSYNDPHGSVLRMVEAAIRVEHLPAVLSHALAGAPEPPAAPPAPLEQLLRVRYGPRARVEATPSGWRCRFGTGERAHATVVIPTRDRLDLLAPCVDSLYATNSGGRFDVIVVDNGSRTAQTRQWLARMQRERDNFRVLAADIEFNWSRLNNLAMAEASGDVFVFLNNDTVSITDGWLARAAEYATRNDVGVVGPLLLFEDGTIQHAGVVVGYEGRAGHVYSGVRLEEAGGMYVSARVSRNVATVTGACLAVSRNVVDTIGAFDEAYRVVCSDTEFCLRAHLAGLNNVYLPEIVLLHHESQSRGRSDPPSDNELLERFIAEHMPRDPFYNPNLTLSSLYPGLPLRPGE